MKTSSACIGFQLPNGHLVPRHFHVTEVGKVTKDYIDCGGKVRSEAVVSFQLWEENDYDHRLHPDKLLNIIEMSEKIFHFEDLEIEVEYQGKETIGKLQVGFRWCQLFINFENNRLLSQRCLYNS